MRRKIGAFAALLLACSLAAGTSFGAAKVGSMAVKEGNLTGAVVDPFGNALAQTQVQVLDKDQKVVASAVADKDGKYTIQGLTAGAYDLKVGDNLSMKLQVAKAAKVRNLKLVIPQGYSAAEVKLPSTALGWGVIVGGAGLITWGALEVMHNNEWCLRKGHEHVSP